VRISSAYIVVLGVEVSQKGFEMEKMKVDMIEKWQAPRNVWGVCEFVRFCNFYQRFIRSFSEVARPLHDLMKVGQLWKWTKLEQSTFDELKQHICESPVLKHADPS
jgi:hypothetical protein